MKRILVLAAIVAASAGSAWAQPEGLIVKRAGDASLPVDPAAATWSKAPAFNVDILPQNMTTPMVQSAAVKNLTVRAVHNGKEIGFLIEWLDPVKDEMPRAGRFVDGVAIELPLNAQEPAAPMMGNPKGRVQIIQWRADWQREVEKGPPRITDLFPNMVNDAPAEDVYKGTDRYGFSGGRVAGNPNSQEKVRAVIDLMAEGFGSLTPKATQSAVGKGVWHNGRWKVVIIRPLPANGDKDAAPLTVGGSSSIAFAVWNGGQGERGSRKGWASWVPLTIEK